MPEVPIVYVTLDGLLILAALVFIWLRGRALLMFYQQEEYDAARFLRWLVARRGFDRTASLFAVFALITATLPSLALAFGDSGADVLGIVILVFGLLAGGWRSRRVTTSSKKPLVMTARARRILILFGIVAITAAAFLSFALTGLRAANLAIVTIIIAQMLPLALVVADALLGPIEARIKARYRSEAVAKLARLDPVVIGITGSYGKTSAKHILAHILSTAAPTLATPGSVNTEMGITRIIREQLLPRHRYFIVEMGAYGRGSIERLCRLTPPQHGMITAVGSAHLERFGDTETVFAAKFELAEAVIGAKGRTVVNAGQIRADLLKTRLDDAGDFFTVVGESECSGVELDYRLKTVDQRDDGLVLEIEERSGETMRLHAPLFGRHQAGNILCTAALARNLGLPWNVIRAALKTVSQIPHRLEVYEQSIGGPLIIDDAYNANPTGFAAGLELLEILRRKNGRRVLITPGMVELGSDHYREHERLGILAAHHCDVALVVTPERIMPFVRGFREKATGDQQLIEFQRQSDAQDWLDANCRVQDVILYENNLPDLYESPVRF